MSSQSNLSRTSVLSLVGMIAAMTAAQILFKYAGIHAANHSGVTDTLLANLWLWAGLSASGVGSIFWLLALKKLPLASAYPWSALIYVFTPLASLLLFDDVLSSMYLMGIICIVAGVFITARGVGVQ